MHTLNDQVFRGLLHRTVSVRQRHRVPALRVAAGGWRVRTVHRRVLERLVRDRSRPRARPARRRPAGRCCCICRAPGCPARRPMPRGRRGSPTMSCRSSCRTSGSRAPNLTVNYGLRWDSQLMPETVDPSTTAFAAFLSDPAFPSDGAIPDQWKMWQPRAGLSWDVRRQRPFRDPGQRGRVFRASEHAEPGRHRSRPTACSSRRLASAPLRRRLRPCRCGPAW